jgi:hypothetical protein
MMDEQSAQEQPARKAAESTSPENPSEKDLSREIERTVAREPLDFVKCVRVFGNYYRCNWWSRAAGARQYLDYAWTGIIVDIVRKSCFLSATMNAGELTLKEIGPVGAHRRNLVREA